MQERREYQRQRICATIGYEGSPDLRCEEVHDISVGGIRIQLSGPETTGRDVWLTIEAEDGSTTVARGRIMWARQRSPFQVGVRFLEVGDAFVAALHTS